MLGPGLGRDVVIAAEFRDERLKVGRLGILTKVG
jgi:hypothetical protein